MGPNWSQLLNNINKYVRGTSRHSVSYNVFLCLGGTKCVTNLGIYGIGESWKDDSFVIHVFNERSKIIGTC